MKRITLLFALLLTVLCSAQFSDNNNRYLLAQNLEQAGEYDKARMIYEDLHRVEPDNIIFFQALNNTYNQLKLYDKSIKLISDRLKINPQDYTLTGMLGKTYYLKGEDKTTFALWDKAIETAGEKAHIARIFSSYCLELRDIDKSIFYLKKAKTFSNNEPQYCLDLLSLYLQTMQYQNGVTEITELLSARPEQVFQVEARINQYLGRREFLDLLIPAMGEADVKATPVMQFFQRLLVQAKKYTRAFEIGKKIDNTGQRQGNDLYQLGIQFYQAGAYTEAADLFRYLIKEYPKTPLATLWSLFLVKSLDAGITRALLSQSPEWKPLQLPRTIPLSLRREIIAGYRQIAAGTRQSEPAAEAKFRLAKIYFEAGVYDSARYYANELVYYNGMSPVGGEANNLMASLFAIANKPDSSIRYLDNIIANPYASASAKSEAKMDKANLIFAAGDFAQARALYGDVASNPKDDDANDALENAMLLNTEMNDSLATLQYAQGLAKLAALDFKSADSLFRGIRLDKNQFYLKSIVELKQVETAIALDNFGGAILLINAINQEKSNIFADRANLWLGKMYLFGLKQPVEAKKLFETFLADYPSSLYVSEVRTLLTEITRQSL